MNHILNNKWMVAGEEIINLKCFICDEDTKHKVSYSGSLCLVCNLYKFDFDDFNHVYEKLKGKMQRKEIAKLLNLSPNTISKYQQSNYGKYNLFKKLKSKKKEIL